MSYRAEVNYRQYCSATDRYQGIYTLKWVTYDNFMSKEDAVDFALRATDVDNYIVYEIKEEETIVELKFIPRVP